jgi:hypothetical protein
VKGNLTRDFERLDDEIALHEVHIDRISDIGFVRDDQNSSIPSSP